MMKNSKSVLTSNLMLITAAAIWGSNFMFQKMAATSIGPFTFMASRCFLGSLTLLILIFCFGKGQNKKYDKHYYRRLAYIAPLCGLTNVFGSVMVQWGLYYTTASKAGFLNSLYIIFVPVIGTLFFKKKATKRMMLGILLASIGLYYLCLSEALTFQTGDLIIICSTFLFATHIHLIGKFVNEFEGLHFSFVEFAFSALVCSIFALCFENPTIYQIEEWSFSILYAGVLGIGVCYALQVTAQKNTDPTIAALLMSLEAVFSAFCGVVFLHETFTFKEIIGVIFIIVAVVTAQLPEKAKKA